ncbi:homeobox domain-containing protein [Hirsutella rhossiliensis]|uniref:Homeobox domain-containing protein n=1 Tax=Hirsutella rhossiliensis TaxID=111463 RepID=A0A9P8MXX1_9HYPO|nr:homeobox domain-containing protein [Hirsutella rhossiliensis]KAH0963219.1 homeobox domain-containing protein [Hirsutella rhossiliensis]
MGSFSQPQWPSWAYPGLEETFSPYSQLPNYPTYLADSMETYQNHHNRHLVHHHHMSRATESKPRLSKEEVEVLEAEFQKNHKPSSSTKKALAESMRVDNARINNWFQNRRAREKKENNIREYEARQRQEKERAEAESGPQPDSSRQCDLVASSAPFPQPRVNSRPRADAQRSPSPMSLPDACSETTEPSQRCDSGSPPLSTPHSRPVTPSIVNFSGLVKPAHSNKVMSGELSDQADGFFNVSDMCVNETRNGLAMEGADLLLSVDTKTSSQLFGEYQGFLGSEAERHDADGLEQGFSAAALPQQSPVSDDSLPTSPQTSDVVSRRHRRPAPLAIGDCRSHSYYTPRTSMDHDRRGDRASPLRRVASSTGSSRVRKAVATPRSPFYDGTADITLQTRRSPGIACPTGSRAPPTPDTPVALHQQGLIDGAMSYSLDRKYMSADMALQDPTLRTPPTTPGFMESLFSMGSGYDMSISEEALISPGIARLPGGFDMSTVTGDMSDFVGSESNRSNEHAPSLLPSQMGHTYFGGNFLGGALAGYDWSDVSTPTISSPGLQHRQPDY